MLSGNEWQWILLVAAQNGIPKEDSGSAERGLHLQHLQIQVAAHAKYTCYAEKHMTAEMATGTGCM
jgi:hypothetical protein